jgi:outer membrane protein insertion porin family
LSRWFAAAVLFHAAILCAGFAGAVTLSDVRVRGNLRVESGLILQQVSSRAGEPYAVDTVRDDIRAIYQLGYFEDIQVELEEGGVLTFLVLERPALREWRAEGVDELEAEDVDKAVPLKKREILDQARVEEGARAIRQLFRDKGFFLARVSSEVLPVEGGKNQAEVVYRAEPGEKVRIKSLNLMGVRSLDEAEVRGVLVTGEAGAWSWLTGSGKFKEADLERDREVIRAFYLNQGYIDVEVLEPLVTLTKDREWIKIDIPVREGRPYRVGKVTFSGDLEYPEGLLLSNAGMVPGKVFRSDDYRAAVDALTDLYGDIGYAFVEVSPRTQRNDEELLLDLDFQIRKGEPVHIGRIEIRGNNKTRDRVIRREMRLDEGDLYNRRLLKRSRAKINGLDFFETFTLNSRRRPGTDLLDLDIEVTEKTTGTFSVGAGYSSADGIIGMGSVSQRNLMGLGYQLSLQANFGSTRETYSLGFNNPRVFDSNIYAGFDVYKSFREYTDYDKDAIGFALKLGTALGEDWRTRWSYRWEEAEVKNIDTFASSTIKEQEGVTITSSITPTLTYDTRDNPWDPAAGTKLDLSVEWAGGLLQGDNEFIKNDVEFSHYRPLWFEHVFLAHAAVGYVFPLKGKEIPIYERYYLGGINSLRGYDLRSVGPIDPENGETIGGDKMVQFNLEYILPLIPEAKVKGVLFFDAGNAWDEDQGYFDSKLLKSVGAGVRWFSPMGPLRLEWGYVLDRRPDDSKSQWEFSVGGYF